MPTGYDSKYEGMTDEELVKALIKAPPFLLTRDEPATSGWNQGAMHAGWMFQATMCNVLH